MPIPQPAPLVRALFVPTNAYPQLVMVAPTLEGLGALLEAPLRLEALTFSATPTERAMAVFDEEGPMRGRGINPLGTVLMLATRPRGEMAPLGQPLHGPVVFLGTDGETWGDIPQGWLDRLDDELGLDIPPLGGLGSPSGLRNHNVEVVTSWD